MCIIVLYAKHCSDRFCFCFLYMEILDVFFFMPLKSQKVYIKPLTELTAIFIDIFSWTNLCHYLSRGLEINLYHKQNVWKCWLFKFEVCHRFSNIIYDILIRTKRVQWIGLFGIPTSSLIVLTEYCRPRNIAFCYMKSPTDEVFAKGGQILRNFLKIEHLNHVNLPKIILNTVIYAVHHFC